MKKDIISVKLIPYICLAFIIMTFAVEFIFDSDWYSNQFYLFRCLRELSMLGIVMYFGLKLYKKSAYNSSELNNELKSYKIIEDFIFVYISVSMILCIFLEEWLPNFGGGAISSYFCIFLLQIPLTLRKFKMKPEEKTRKRNYVILIIFTILGIYFAIGNILWLSKLISQVV